MKKIIFFFLAVFISVSANSQEKKIDKLPDALQYHGLYKNEDFFNKSEFIFEGEIISTENFLNKDSSKVYSSSLIKVTTLLKGKIDSDTIELVRDCGQFTTSEGNLILDYNSELCLSFMGQKSIFFAKKRNDISFRKNISCKLEPFLNEPYAALYFSELPKEHNFLLFGLKHLYFKTKEDFYKYASRFDGVTVPSESKKKVSLKSGVINAEQQQKLNNFMDWQNQLLNYAKLNKTKASNVKTTNDLSISIANQSITGTTTMYFEFDVSATASSNSTYYDNAISRIDFNTDIFGYDLNANNKITLTPDPAFSSSTYEVNVYDVTSNRVNISLNVKQGLTSWTRTQLSTSPIVLFHVKMEVLPTATNGYANLSFQEVDFTSMFSLYSLSATADYTALISYDNTIYSNPPAFSIALNPVINSFSPWNVKAGTGDVLYIYGNNFGDIAGEVWFKNADKGGASFISGSSAYIKSWSNTNISVVVPSYTQDKYDGKWYCAGTGDFMIITSIGKQAMSPSSLTVDYAISNIGIPTATADKRLYLVQQNGVNGIKFTLHTSVQGNNSAINCIKQALGDWSGRLGIEVKLETDASGNPIFTSSKNIIGKNVIFFEPTRTGGMQTTTHNGNFCTVGGSEYTIIKDRFDIAMAPQSAIALDGTINPWNYQTSGTVYAGYGSFYQAFLHEVGHSLGLKHVIDPLALMYWNMDNSKSNRIINLASSKSTPVAAVAREITDSRNINWGCSGISTINYVKPTITYFAINNGAASTKNIFRSVSLNNKCTAYPTDFMVSENSNFSGASWIPYNENPVYHMSPGYGYKTVFFKVKNAAGEAYSVDQIYYEPILVFDDYSMTRNELKGNIVEQSNADLLPVVSVANQTFNEGVKPEEFTISAYPIPCTDYLTIIIPYNENDFHVELVSVYGNVVYSNKITGSDNNINISTIPKGTYLIRLYNNHKVYTKTIIKQ